jgi:hypothetical protein
MTALIILGLVAALAYAAGITTASVLIRRDLRRHYAPVRQAAWVWPAEKTFRLDNAEATFAPNRWCGPLFDDFTKHADEACALTTNRESSRD